MTSNKPFHLQRNIKPKNWGSAEYYSDLFSDIVADAATGEPEQDKEVTRNILTGFRMAIESWADYHKSSAIIYDNMLTRFIY